MKLDPHTRVPLWYIDAALAELNKMRGRFNLPPLDAMPHGVPNNCESCPIGVGLAPKDASVGRVVIRFPNGDIAGMNTNTQMFVRWFDEPNVMLHSAAKQSRKNGALVRITT